MSNEVEPKTEFFIGIDKFGRVALKRERTYRNINVSYVLNNEKDIAVDIQIDTPEIQHASYGETDNIIAGLNALYNWHKIPENAYDRIRHSSVISPEDWNQVLSCDC